MVVLWFYKVNKEKSTRLNLIQKAGRCALGVWTTSCQCGGMHRNGQAHLYMCKFVWTSFLPCSLWHRVSQINQSSMSLLQGSCLPSKHWNYMWITNCPGSSWVLRLQTQILTLSCKVLYQLSHLPSIQNASFRDYSEEQTPKAVSAMRKGLPCASAKLWRPPVHWVWSSPHGTPT